MRKLILLSILLLSSVYAYSQTSTFGGIGLRVNDSTSYQSNASGAHSAGYYDIYFNNQATHKHWDVWNGSSYDHVFDFNGSGGSGTPGGSNTQVQYNDSGAFGGEADFIYDESTNTLTVDNAAVDTEAYDATGWNGDLTVPTKDATRDKIETLQSLSNSATALVDASTIDLTTIKHTLASSSATRTFTISYTGDDIIIEVTLSAATATYTFPATSLCVSEGSASGNNTLALSGVSGDKYIIAVKKIGSAYYVVSKNFGQ